MSLPDDLLTAIDKAAQERSTSRSALLAEAARRELARRDPDQIVAAIERSTRRFADAGAFESADMVRRDRDAHR